MLSRMSPSSLGGITTRTIRSNRRDELFRLFDPRAGRGADVQPDLTRIDAREEILAHEWHEAGGHRAEHDRGQRDEPAGAGARRRVRGNRSRSCSNWR